MPDQLNQALIDRADPLQSFQKAQTIGPFKGNYTPLDTPTDSYSIGGLIRSLLGGRGKVTPQGGPALDEPAAVAGVIGGGGDPKSELLAEMKKRFRVPNGPFDTDWLLPDATRLKKVAGGSHDSEMYQQTGKGLKDALGAGVIRYAPPLGVEVSSPISHAQAQTIADDWVHHFARDLGIDVNVGGQQISRNIPSPNASKIRNIIAQLLETK